MNIEHQYKRHTGRQRWILLLLLLLLGLAALLSTRTGSLPISRGEMIRALAGLNTDGQAAHVIWKIRLPRTVAALGAGAGLAVAGVVMQNILKNPLASPFTIGVSQGAACGAAFAIIILGAGATRMAGNDAITVGSPGVIVICALVGAMLAVGLILFLSSLRGITTHAVILAGVALSAFFGSVTMLLQYFAEDVQVAASVFWTFGDLSKAGWAENLAIFTAVALGLGWAVGSRWNFNALAWGDEVAGSLGVRVQRLRVLAMLLAALMVAVATSFLGIIGFVGLIAPHLMRLVVGTDHRHLVAAAATFGALLLLCADLIARTALAPAVLPVGIITSFAGAPLFLYLLIKPRRV